MASMAPEQKQAAEVAAPQLHPSRAAVAARQPVAAEVASLVAEVAAALERPVSRYQKCLELWHP